MDREIARISNLPEKQTLQTLDGQAVPLIEFFAQCSALWPSCALYHKFYHWRKEVIRVESKSSKGQISHRIRVYYNPLSVCHPENVGAGRTHGDVAEFYDINGDFMGLAVYMGQGLYVPLPYSDHRPLSSETLLPETQ